MQHPFYKNHGPVSINEILNILKIKQDVLSSDLNVIDIKDLYHSNKFDIRMAQNQRFFYKTS